MATCQEQIDDLRRQVIELQKELARVRLNTCRLQLRNPQINHILRKEMDDRIQIATRHLRTGSPCGNLISQIEQVLGLDE